MVLHIIKTALGNVSGPQSAGAWALALGAFGGYTYWQRSLNGGQLTDAERDAFNAQRKAATAKDAPK